MESDDPPPSEPYLGSQKMMYSEYENIRIMLAIS